MSDVRDIMIQPMISNQGSNINNDWVIDGAGPGAAEPLKDVANKKN
jgi:hypothetical protein